MIQNDITFIIPSSRESYLNISPPTAQQQSDILELLEWRYNTHSTIFASQYIPQGWHKNLGSSAIADAILDRIKANSYLIHIKRGKSMRVTESE